MNDQDILDVLAVRDILASGNSMPKTVAALIDWKNGTVTHVATSRSVLADVAKAQVVEPEPGPPEPVAPPVRKAAAKAPTKSKARTEPAEPDDSVTSSDPSDDDAF